MENSPTKAKKIVKEALKLNPENVRTITILGDTSTSVDQAMLFYLKAMDIAKRQFGDAFLRKTKAIFGGMHETRPKMSYADRLSQKNKITEAIEQYQEMLKLNPYDIVYDAFLKLRKQFDEASTFWLFNLCTVIP